MICMLKDIQVKTSLHSRMKEGLYVSGDTLVIWKIRNNKNHLVVNNEQAEVVKLIFDLALKGNTYHYIAQKLTKRKLKLQRLIITMCGIQNVVQSVYHKNMVYGLIQQLKQF